MKKIHFFLIFFLLVGAIAAQAQNHQTSKQHDPVNPQKDKRHFQGHTIRIVPLAENSYGYEITKGKELLVLQTMNPFTQSIVGLETKEDAYNVAMWSIRQLLQEEDELKKGANKNRGQVGVRMNEFIPINVARELNIRLKHL